VYLKTCLKIGLVTHANSSYLDSGGNHKLFKDLINQLELSSYYISDLDMTFPEIEEIHTKMELDSLIILFISLVRTRINLLYYSKLKNIFSVFIHILNAIYIIFQLLIKLFLSRLSKVSNYKYRLIMSRQHNISESHIAQFIDSVKSNSDFSLILEDDFKINQDYSIELTINSLLEFMKINSNVSVISVSESFSFLELGISNTVRNIQSDNLNLYEATLPVTNTVSAMLYKTQFLKQILPYLLEYRKYRIIPIDHKINMALHQIYKKKNFESDFFYFMQPGLFIQDSIHGR
jgi:hypothetical protein